MTPSVRRILWVDATASIALKVVAALVGSLVFAFFLSLAPWADAQQVGRVAGPRLVPFVLVACATCLPLVAFRVARIRRVFSTGTRVLGRVDHIDITRGTGRIAFSYPAAGFLQEVRYMIKRTDAGVRLAEGSEIEVVVDPRAPDRAYPIALFLG